MKKRNSEIMNSIDFIVKIIGFAILPVGGLLFWKQYFVLGDTFQNSVVMPLTTKLPESSGSPGCLRTGSASPVSRQKSPAIWPRPATRRWSCISGGTASSTW